jgi:hypothetical protein
MGFFRPSSRGTHQSWPPALTSAERSAVRNLTRQSGQATQKARDLRRQGNEAGARKALARADRINNALGEYTR